MALQKLSKLRTGKALVLLLDSSGNNPVIAEKVPKGTKSIKKVRKNA